MKWWRWAICCILAISHGTALAQSNALITVGLTDFQQAPTVRCQVAEGSYRWLVRENDAFTELGALTKTGEIKKASGGWEMHAGGANRISPYFILKPDHAEAKIKLISETTGYRQYRGAVHFYWHANEWHIALETPMESYVPGVVVSEIGKGHAEAMYEAHAIVSRTYALHTSGRHRLAGYDVCDQVHCQVFAGLSTVNDTIEAACDATRSLVLVDRLGRPVVAAFHSNCGGATRSSEAVWQTANPNLVTVEDHYCQAGAHAAWTQSVGGEQWRIWQETSDSTERFDIATRHWFKLPSARFNAVDLGDTVTIHGMGFGHGVGMCQEGAMQRARQGTSAWMILNTYYTDIRLRPLQEVTTLESNASSDR